MTKRLKELMFSPQEAAVVGIVEAALKAKLAAVTAERDALREALEYCIILDNLYVGDSFQNEPKGSNAARLADIWGQMIECVDAALNPPAMGDGGDQPL